MVEILRRLAVALTVTMLGAAASPSLAEVTIKNTSTYVGAGRWEWAIFVDTDPGTLQQIECVEYILHPTFSDPVQRVCNHPETKFAYSTSGWGTFTVKLNIHYKSGRVETLEHPLVFKAEPAPTSLNVAVKNSSRQIEPGWWEWVIYIEGATADLDRIRCVEYTLHPTFPNPVRVVCSRTDRFQLTARGWGSFTVRIKLILDDGSIRQLSHALELR